MEHCTMRVLRILALSFLLFAAWFLASLASYKYIEARQVVSVSDPLPAIFPVLVTFLADSGNLSCRIVYHDQLEGFRRAVPETSLLIPAGFESACLEQVREFTRVKDSNFDSDDPRPWSAGFQMSKLSADRQLFEVSATWDDDHVNRSWYEATELDLFAAKHLYLVGPGVALEALAVGTGITAAVVAILLAIWLVRRHRSRRHARANCQAHVR
jgi:hypothetical protein